MYWAEPCKRSEPAVRAGDDALAPHAFRVPDQPLRDEFRMLDKVAARIEHAWNQDLFRRELVCPPDFPFVLVARICAFDQKCHRLRFEQQRQHLK